MCGLAGLYETSGANVDPALMARMADALAHRGPDSHGVWAHGRMGFGFRRLAIIDLSRDADQPMLTPDGKHGLIFNGEIYNFRELRAELEAAGIRFRTRSDAEVVLMGCAHWGVEAFAVRMNGMAAFAFWDIAEERVHLVRDRFGVKPLYLWRRPGGGVAFASEVKAFMADPRFVVRVNETALSEYFTFQNLFRDHTLFEGVETLPAGTILTLSRDGERRTRYWDYDFSRRDENMSMQDAIDGTRDRMRAAVTRQLVADVPVGAYLSGGVDSSSIVAIAAPQMARMTTFTAGFEMSAVEGIERTFDERREAELTAHHFRTEHYEQVINAGDIAWAMPRVIWQMEDLRLGMSYPNYYIARLASRFAKVCLTGAGGDEIFGGYPWRYYRVAGATDRQNYMSRYYAYWQRLTGPGDRAQLFTRGANGDVEADMVAAFEGVFAGKGDLRHAGPEDHIANALYFECKTFLHGLLLLGDKLSMAHGLEERHPFLDNDLVDFAQAIPVRHKVLDTDGPLTPVDEDAERKRAIAELRFNTGKAVLRQAMDGLVPDVVRARAKQGFTAPDGSWYRGENAQYVRELLLGPDLAMEGYIRPDFVRRVVNEHLAGEANHRLLIWSFLSFEHWCRIFLGGARPTP